MGINADNDPYVLANRACRECYDAKTSIWFDVRDIIALAILAENERCAKIAEDLKENPQAIRLAMGEMSGMEMRSVKAVLGFVSAAIRRR